MEDLQIVDFRLGDMDDGGDVVVARVDITRPSFEIRGGADAILQDRQLVAVDLVKAKGLRSRVCDPYLVVERVGGCPAVALLGRHGSLADDFIAIGQDDLAGGIVRKRDQGAPSHDREAEREDVFSRRERDRGCGDVTGDRSRLERDVQQLTVRGVVPLLSHIETVIRIVDLGGGRIA